MADIEDVVFEVRLNPNVKPDSYFSVKVRSKKHIKSNENVLSTKKKTTDGIETIDFLFKNYTSDNFDCGDNKCCKNDNNLKNCNTVISTKVDPKLSKAVLKSERNMTTKHESDLPWRNIVYLRTWGCSHNNSDSEYMAGLLLKAGYTVTLDRNQAALWLLNSCTVKTPSEIQLSNQIQSALASNKKVVVSGCVSQASPSVSWLKDISIIGVQQIDRIVEVVDETLKGNVVRLLSVKRKTVGGKLPLDLPKMRRNKFVEILAINSGCLNHCTYCKTKQARGDLRSFDLESLVERARSALVDENCRELWLTSEDLGAWGRDIGFVLPDLLQELVKVIPEGCMMRLGMTNPPYILDCLEEIAEILRHPRVYAFLHIPVQAGSDAVLSEMRREYTSDHFCRIMDYMIKNVPGIYIATDFICAFPTETKEDFLESLELVKKYRFPSLFINQYYPRPGTPAARLKKIETVEARRRTGEMSKLFHSYSRYSADRVGTIERVLICEMATDKIHYVGHNKSYEHILVAPPMPKHGSCAETLLGKWVIVRITEVSKFYMKASVTIEEAQKSCLHWTSNSLVVTFFNKAKSLFKNSLKNANPFIKIVVITHALIILYFIVKFVIINVFAL